MNTRTDLIGDMVAEDFRTAAIFKKYGIDFCCKGGRTIEQACDKKDLDPNKIYSELQNLPISGASGIDFKSWREEYCGLHCGEQDLNTFIEIYNEEMEKQ